MHDLLEQTFTLDRPLERTFLANDNIIVERTQPMTTQKMTKMIKSIEDSCLEAGRDLVTTLDSIQQKSKWMTSMSVQHSQALTQESDQVRKLVVSEVVRAKMFLGKMQQLNNEAQNLAVVHSQLKDMLRLISYLEAAADRLLVIPPPS
eukprot:c3945_g1_i1.p1 GENE.c3945_g1_i1~~c3945_g1_i1.p1  ORF type:complete len:160 (+),score=35.99 c3945_g1_i1:37-480(+)